MMICDDDGAKNASWVSMDIEVQCTSAAMADVKGCCYAPNWYG